MKSHEAKPRSPSGLLHLLIVYCVWGSTFLAIRVGVQGEGAFPPLTLAAMRVLSAGLILLCLAIAGKSNLRLPRRELAHLALSGILFWVGGHALVIWAAQWTDSGHAALVFATVPLWTALIEAIRDPSARSVRQLIPVLSGFCGILLLTAGGARGDLLPTLVLLLSALSWSLATIMTPSPSLPITVSAGYQQLFAGLVCAAAALALGERPDNPSVNAIGAWVYLTLIGSVLAFTSYVRASQLLPAKLISSFAYVNPVIAVALGAAVFGERLGGPAVVGMGLVLFSVMRLFSQSGGSTQNAKPTTA